MIHAFSEKGSIRPTLFVAALFVCGGIWNLAASGGTFPDAAVCFGIAALLGWAFWFFRREERLSAEFLSWLVTNRKPIEDAKPLRYSDMSISKTTEVTQYWAAMSFLVLSIKAPSRLYLEGQHPGPLVGGLYTVVSLVLGWWGIPWGPIYTVQSAFSNILGGKRRTIQDLLAKMDPGSSMMGAPT